MASIRLGAPSFCMIAERWLRFVAAERWRAPASSATARRREHLLLARGQGVVALGERRDRCHARRLRSR
jgi:hypothetical protein